MCRYIRLSKYIMRPTVEGFEVLLFYILLRVDVKSSGILNRENSTTVVGLLGIMNSIS